MNEEVNIIIEHSILFCVINNFMVLMRSDLTMLTQIFLQIYLQSLSRNFTLQKIFAKLNFTADLFENIIKFYMFGVLKLK